MGNHHAPLMQIYLYLHRAPPKSYHFVTMHTGAQHDAQQSGALLVQYQYQHPGRYACCTSVHNFQHCHNALQCTTSSTVTMHPRSHLHKVPYLPAHGTMPAPPGNPPNGANSYFSIMHPPRKCTIVHPFWQKSIICVVVVIRYGNAWLHAANC